MQYYVAKCPKCGSIQSNGTQRDMTKAVLICRYCSKSTKLFNKKERYFVVKTYAKSRDPHYITKVCSEIKEKLENEPKKIQM